MGRVSLKLPPGLHGRHERMKFSVLPVLSLGRHEVSKPGEGIRMVFITLDFFFYCDFGPRHVTRSNFGQPDRLASSTLILLPDPDMGIQSTMGREVRHTQSQHARHCFFLYHYSTSESQRRTPLVRYLSLGAVSCHFQLKFPPPFVTRYRCLPTDCNLRLLFRCVRLGHRAITRLKASVHASAPITGCDCSQNSCNAHEFGPESGEGKRPSWCCIATSHTMISHRKLLP